MKTKNTHLKSYYIDPETEEIIEYIEGLKCYNIYILYKDSNPIYVGQSLNMKNRIRQHRKNGKDFDDYCVAHTCYNELSARTAEQVLIAYLNSTTAGLQNKNNVGKIGDIFHLSKSSK